MKKFILAAALVAAMAPAAVAQDEFAPSKPKVNSQALKISLGYTF